MIRYPLAVTQFSPEQCGGNLQWTVIHTLLPKTGLNQHTPRVVIYVPMTLGRREIMDLRVEQITTQWETTKGHICQVDRAGKGLALTMNDHQCIIGSSKLFLNLNPDKYNYGVENTRWNFTWKEPMG